MELYVTASEGGVRACVSISRGGCWILREGCWSDCDEGCGMGSRCSAVLSVVGRAGIRRMILGSKVVVVVVVVGVVGVCDKGGDD